MISYCDEICLTAMQAATMVPIPHPVVYGLVEAQVKVTVVLTGSDQDESLLIAATLVKARSCSGLTYVAHVLADDLTMPRQVLGHAFALGEQVSWMMAWGMEDNGAIRMVQPYRLSVVAPAVEILECGLKGDTEYSYIAEAKEWLLNRGHEVLVTT